MELTILSTIFGQKIQDFRGGPPSSKIPAPTLIQGYVASFRARGPKMLLFVTPDRTWLWNGVSSDELTNRLQFAGDLFVFDVQRSAGSIIYVTDVLVYAGRSIVTCDFRERLETVRKLFSTHPETRAGQPLREQEDPECPTTCPSAHADCHLMISDEISIGIKQIYPSVYVDLLWTQLPKWADGITLDKLLAVYSPFVCPPVMRS